MIAVPNYNCSGQKRQGPHWVWLQQPFVHIWHYSPKSIIKYLEFTGFEVLDLTTRDTWDAQFLYDDIVQPKMEERGFKLIGYYCEAILRRLGFKNIENLQKFYFYSSEINRLVMYMIYLIIRPIISSKNSGSELFVIARVRR